MSECYTLSLGVCAQVAIRSSNNDGLHQNCAQVKDQPSLREEERERERERERSKTLE